MTVCHHVSCAASCARLLRYQRWCATHAVGWSVLGQSGCWAPDGGEGHEERAGEITRARSAIGERREGMVA